MRSYFFIHVKPILRLSLLQDNDVCEIKLDAIKSLKILGVIFKKLQEPNELIFRLHKIIKFNIFRMSISKNIIHLKIGLFLVFLEILLIILIDRFFLLSHLILNFCLFIVCKHKFLVILDVFFFNLFLIVPDNTEPGDPWLILKNGPLNIIDQQFRRVVFDIFRGHVIIIDIIANL